MTTPLARFRRLLEKHGIYDEAIGLLRAHHRTLTEEHLGFDKLRNKLAKKGDVDDPDAVAAAIGRKKYGAKGMAAKAAAGHK